MHPVWVLILLTISLAPLAAAHGDQPAQQATVVLDPGGSVTWTQEVHWHRLMGTVDATGPVTVLVEGPEGTGEAAGPGQALRVDHLVSCCRAAVWTPHTIQIDNVADHPIEVNYDLVLLHDNLVVLAEDAEPGGWWQTLAIVGLMIAIPAWRARQPSLQEAPGRWVRSSRLLHGAAWGLAGSLAAIGMIRFSTGPLTGSLGATAWVPGDVAGFFNTHSLVMLGLMGLWGAALACWAGARRRGPSPGAYRWDGFLFAAGSLLVGGLMAAESGRWAIPVVLGTVPAVALVLDVVWTTPSRSTEA